MKKFSIIFLSLVLSTYAFSQEADNALYNRHGVNILPEKGEIAISIDAVPFLNLLNDRGAGVGFNYVHNIPAFGFKYFTSNTTALRLDFRIGYGSDKLTNRSHFEKESGGSFGFGIGHEKRLGSSRVQGFYGFGGGFLYEKIKHSNDGGRVSLDNSVFGIGANFFLGAEVFIATKLSIGGEFNWGPTYLINKDILSDTSTSGFIIGTGNAGGALMLNFHF